MKFSENVLCTEKCGCKELVILEQGSRTLTGILHAMFYSQCFSNAQALYLYNMGLQNYKLGVTQNTGYIIRMILVKIALFAPHAMFV